MLALRVKFPYWGVLNYADSLCIKISPIFYIKLILNLTQQDPVLPSTEIIPKIVQSTFHDRVFFYHKHFEIQIQLFWIKFFNRARGYNAMAYGGQIMRF